MFLLDSFMRFMLVISKRKICVRIHSVQEEDMPSFVWYFVEAGETYCGQVVVLDGVLAHSLQGIIKGNTLSELMRSLLEEIPGILKKPKKYEFTGDEKVALLILQDQDGRVCVETICENGCVDFSNFVEGRQDDGFSLMGVVPVCDSRLAMEIQDKLIHCMPSSQHSLDTVLTLLARKMQNIMIHMKDKISA